MTRRHILAWLGRRDGVRPGDLQASGHGPGRDDNPSPAGTAPIFSRGEVAGILLFFAAVLLLVIATALHP